MSRLSQFELKKLLSYNPFTGSFVWRNNPKKGLDGTVAGHLNEDGYCVIGVGRRYYKASRLAWLHEKGVWPEGEIDHKNTDRSDNCIDNLRLATRSQNCMNRRPNKDSRSGLKGVCWEKHVQKWSARIGLGNGKKKYLGLFDCAEDAARARDRASVLYFGRFAYLNFPEEHVL